MDYLRARFLQELNDEGDIFIRGLSWSRQQILETMDPTANEEVFAEWVDQEKTAAKDRVRDFLAANGCLDRFRTLTELVRNGSVVPFIGAGMSVSSGFKPWGDFLLSLLPDAPQIVGKVSDLLAQSSYEEAAQAVYDEIGADIFSEEVSSRLGSHRSNFHGPIQILPFVFKHEVLTTNFDYVLSNVYRGAGLPFVREYCGAGLGDAPKRLATEPHCLLRLHGEADSDHGRVLTKAEYEAAYADSSTLPALLQRIVGTKSLLFLGCSLQSDRTFAALVALKSAENVAGPRHYAFLSQPAEEHRTARRTFLAAGGVHPVYY
ncbi:SIR2 family protein, partial [Mesorhizobium sp.]|uniref:SIR2 family protein n=1 Tax=Mesorhizobium sp. TaxID=1871066 RepID=UPI0011F63DDC